MSTHICVPVDGNELMLTRRYSSLSIKNNASQEQILFELEQLKYSFKEALRVSSRPSRGSLHGRAEHPDARVSRNLHNLAAAAREFHSTASSTSGTTGAGSSAQWQFVPPSSLIVDLPEHKRQRVEEFIQAGRYPSLETVSATRQSSLRTPSLSSSQNIAPPAPREVPTVRDDNVVASEPMQNVSEIDDDEELEEESREYFDGLRDLARDRITKQDYTKAIEFITQAMTKIVTLDEMDEVAMQLQVQLALCHFFKGDWRSAEPIVLRLATLALNEVTCNLLHALSLAHLFQYSLDSALRFCRKAWKGKRDILEKKHDLDDGATEADYGNTVALCSTIYHMKGDPIFAEVFHRRLPKGFEYQHPSSELEFIFSHPRLLPAVLGDDIPKFKAGRPDVDFLDPESFFVFGWETVPQDAQKLYKSGGVAKSPLRQRFARHELYESDTDKIVLEGPSPCSPCSPADSGIDMTADDEMQPAEALVNLEGASDTSVSEEPVSEGTAVDDTPYHEMPSEALNPAQGHTNIDASGTSASDATLTGETVVDETVDAGPPPEPSKMARESSPVRLPLRRRVTRMFNARRPWPTAAGGKSIEPLTCPPEPSANSRGWFHNPSRPGVGRSKTLLRNTSSDVGCESEPKAKIRGVQKILRLGLVEMTFKRTARVLEATSKKTGVDELPGVGEEACFENRLDNCYHSGVLAAGPPSGQSRGRLSGLTKEYHGPDAGVGPYTCNDPQWPVPSRRPLIAGNVTVPHEPGDIVAAVELGDSGPNSRLRSDENTPYSGGIVSRSESHHADPEPTTRESFGTPVSSTGRALTNDASNGEAQMTVHPSRSRVKGKERLRLDTSVTFEQLHDPARCRAQLPGRLACVLTSLSTATDTEKQAMGLELERLAQHVHTCLNDPTLGTDLQRIIDTLSINKPSETDNSHGCTPRITVDKEEPGSPKSSSEPLPSCEASSTEELASSQDAQQDLDSAIRQDGDKPLRPSILTSRHSFIKGDEANFKFFKGDEANLKFLKVNQSDGRVDGSRCSTAASAPQAQIPSELCRGERPARCDLQRAFSFLAGDDARYSRDGATADTRSVERREEAENVDRASLVTSPVQKKYVSWAAADLVVPAVPNKEAVRSGENNKDEERRNEQRGEATKGQQQSSGRRPRFGAQTLSFWKRAKHKDICNKARK